MPVELIDKSQSMSIEHIIVDDNKNSVLLSDNITKISNATCLLERLTSTNESKSNVGSYPLPSSIQLPRGYTHYSPNSAPLLKEPDTKNILKEPDIQEYQGSDYVDNIFNKSLYSAPENDFAETHENSVLQSRKRCMGSVQSETLCIRTEQTIEGAALPKIFRSNSFNAAFSPGAPSSSMPHLELLSPGSPSSHHIGPVSPYLSSSCNSPESSEYSPYSDSEIFVNAWRNSISLPQGSHINGRGYIERNNFNQLYRVEKIDRSTRRGDPEEVGFRESNRFEGMPKMIDGQVLIVSLTKEGAERFGNVDYGQGNFHLYEIDVNNMNAVSMAENVDKNERFMEEVKDFEPGFVQQLRSENRLKDFSADYDEVHLAMDDLTPDRVRKLY